MIKGLHNSHILATVIKESTKSSQSKSISGSDD